STRSAALLIGLGSLHWTILGTTDVTALYWLMYRFALPLLPVVGIALPMAVVALTVRGVFRQLAEAEAEDTANPVPIEIPARVERNDAHADPRTPGPTGCRERHLEKGSAV